MQLNLKEPDYYNVKHIKNAILGFILGYQYGSLMVYTNHNAFNATEEYDALIRINSLKNRMPALTIEIMLISIKYIIEKKDGDFLEDYLVECYPKKFCLSDGVKDSDIITRKALVRYLKAMHESKTELEGFGFEMNDNLRRNITLKVNSSKYKSHNSENANTNTHGALMRILPFAFLNYKAPLHERWQMTKRITQITHPHIRSTIANFYFLELIRNIVLRKENFPHTDIIPQSREHLLAENIRSFAIDHTNKNVLTHLINIGIEPNEIHDFMPVLSRELRRIFWNPFNPLNNVLETFEHGVFNFNKADSFENSIRSCAQSNLTKSEMPHSTAIAGALSGSLFGLENVSELFLGLIPNLQQTIDLCDEFAEVMSERNMN